MSKIKRVFLKITHNSGSTLEKLLMISFIFLLTQISLTSIFIFLEPKLYVSFQGFHIKENIFLYLWIISFIFIANLIFSILYKLFKKTNEIY